MGVRIVFLLFLLPVIVVGQEICIDNNPVLDRLYKDTNSISTIENFDIDANPRYLPISEKYIKGYRQRLIKSKKHLYIQIDATGRVYKATSLTAEKICFTRIDSTYFIGYNGDQIVFEQNDTLFALGGEGFWRKNGQLRYYSPIQNEWNILKINKELPVQNMLYHMKDGNTKIYYLQTAFVDQATGEVHSKYIITLMDVLNRKNTELGEFNPILSKFLLARFYERRTINAPKLNGTLVAFHPDNIYLFDFENNAVFRLINKQIKDVFFGNSNGIVPLQLFESGDSIFYCNSNDTTLQLHSFPISKNDFVRESYPLYIKTNKIKDKILLLIPIFLTLLAFVLAKLYARKKRYASNHFNENVTEKYSPDVEFNQIEIELIKKLTSEQVESITLSVEEINAVLGLSKKSIEIQKKIRTETINRINHKFKIIFNSNDQLIERVRQENDRRYYMYSINKENKKIISPILKRSN